MLPCVFISVLLLIYVGILDGIDVSQPSGGLRYSVDSVVLLEFGERPDYSISPLTRQTFQNPEYFSPESHMVAFAVLSLFADWELCFRIEWGAS